LAEKESFWKVAEWTRHDVVSSLFYRENEESFSMVFLSILKHDETIVFNMEELSGEYRILNLQPHKIKKLSIP